MKKTTSTDHTRKWTLFIIIPVILIVALLLYAITAHAQPGHVTLLTVSDDAAETGGTADLYLTVKPGSGSVFIDSFPLTRLDTQSSVRYANQIACDLIQADCESYDFFYTIRANSAIVGGPSAGAAIAVLTVATLDHQALNQHTAMTGTINSGGVIGPVAGVPAKVLGAKAAGITKVLIPSLTSFANNTNASNQSNQSLSEVMQTPLLHGKVPELSRDGVLVLRVDTIEDALLEFTGKNYSKALPPLQPSPIYVERMRKIADDICTRTALLEANASNLRYNDTNNYTKRIAAIDASHQYSRASLCFSQNIELSTLLLQHKNNATRYDVYRDLRVQAQQLDAKTRNTTIATIGDLETYAIVKERIVEAQELLDADDARDPHNLAYAQERLVSARTWSQFFGTPGEHVKLDSEHLQRTCLAKLEEADERINYVRLYAPRAVADAEDLLKQAQTYSSNEPVLCIFTASKAKAEANLLANAISVGQESVDALIQEKLAADVVVLRKQQAKGFFPIIGYSYTQYAQDLRQQTPYNALTFAEYALELSNLDTYFPRAKAFSLPPGFTDALAFFIFGAVFGAGLAFFLLGRRWKGTPTIKTRRKR